MRNYEKKNTIFRTFYFIVSVKTKIKRRMFNWDIAIWRYVIARKSDLYRIGHSGRSPNIDN